MNYIAIFDHDFLSNFRLDDEDKLTLVLTDKTTGTRAVRLKPLIRPTITTEEGESVYLTQGHIDVLLKYEELKCIKEAVDRIWGKWEKSDRWENINPL